MFNIISQKKLNKLKCLDYIKRGYYQDQDILVQTFVNRSQAVALEKKSISKLPSRQLHDGLLSNTHSCAIFLRPTKYEGIQTGATAWTSLWNSQKVAVKQKPCFGIEGRQWMCDASIIFQQQQKNLEHKGPHARNKVACFWRPDTRMSATLLLIRGAKSFKTNIISIHPGSLC